MQSANYMQKWVTLTGYNLLEAYKELDRDLGEKAYCPIEGGKGKKLNLTDIKPVYLPELLTKLFGFIGVGWGFDVLEQKTTSQSVPRNGGYEEVEFTSSAKVQAWFVYFNDEGEIKKSLLPIMTGSNTNTVLEWTEKGSVTNALGAIWSFAGYQISVYKNERTNKNLYNNKPAFENPPVSKPSAAPQKIELMPGDKLVAKNKKDKSGKETSEKWYGIQRPGVVGYIFLKNKEQYDYLMACSNKNTKIEQNLKEIFPESEYVN